MSAREKDREKLIVMECGEDMVARVILLILICGLGVFFPGPQSLAASYDQRSTPIAIHIQTGKPAYAPGEPVEGTIVLRNTYPSSLSAVFYIKILRDGQVYSELITSIKEIWPGTTRYFFKDFGIPAFNAGAESTGRWRIEVFQKDVDPYYGSAVDLLVNGKEKQTAPEQPGKSSW